MILSCRNHQVKRVVFLSAVKVNLAINVMFIIGMELKKHFTLIATLGIC